MSLAERNFHHGVGGLGMVYACKKFQHYLLKYRIVFHTDHDSLEYLVNKPNLSEWIAR